MRKCKWCKTKELLKWQKKFCSIECRDKYFEKYKIGLWNSETGRKGGKIGGKKVHELYPNLASDTIKKTNKKYPHLTKERGQRAVETNRKNKAGSFFNLEQHRKVGKIGGKHCRDIHPEHLREIGAIGGKSTHNRYPRHLSEIGKIGGVNSQKTLRENVRTLKFKEQYYDSPDETGISASLSKQFRYIPIEGKTLHIRMKGGEIDFLLKKLKLFIEYHSFWRKDDMESQYYKKRRNILNKNGYKDYSLLVIK